MTAGRPGTGLAALAALALAAVLVSCAEPKPGESAATENTAAAIPASPVATTPAVASTSVNPAGGVAPDKGEAAAGPAPAPPPPAIEPAANVRSDPALAADAPSGVATAYWGNRNLGSSAPWRSVAGDGIHDSGTEAARLLQSPRAALRGFPRANSGNLVDWVAAFDQGLIRPRGNVPEVLNTNVVLTDTKGMPNVVFPHRPHTEQLVCGNCHDWLFKKQAGSTDITMASIARGRSCGVCHGKVAFPPTECFRCHSGPRPK